MTSEIKDKLQKQPSSVKPLTDVEQFNQLMNEEKPFPQLTAQQLLQIEQKARSDEREKCEKAWGCQIDEIVEHCKDCKKKIHDEARAEFLAVIDGKIGELNNRIPNMEKNNQVVSFEEYVRIEAERKVLTDLKEKIEGV
jgi:hypothetical protein